METATQVQARDLRQDRRRHETRVIGNAVFEEIRNLLPSEVGGEVHARLLDALYRNGVLLIRDDEREKLGLEPCDEKGWTPSEQVKSEQAKLDPRQSFAAVFMKLGK